MKKILNKKFFNRSTITVSKELIGKYLVRNVRGREYAYMIIETEAYDGFEDKASHAYRGKTKRNEIMFQDAGKIYVYLTYGMHFMLNIVTGKEEYPAAVLIRGVEGITGPGRITKALKINKSLNAKLLNKNSGLWIEDRGVKIKKEDIIKTPRIGINYAEEWKDKPYRFLLENRL